MKKLHILFVPSWYISSYQPYNGIFFREQAEILASSGHRVGIIHLRLNSIKKSPRLEIMKFSETNSLNIKTLILDSINLKFDVFSYIQWITMLPIIFKRYIKLNGIPDIIHAQGTFWGGVAAVKLGKRYGIPVVIGEHSSLFEKDISPRWKRNVLIDSLKNSERIYCVSKDLATNLSKYSDKKISIVHNPVNIDEFELRGLHREAGRFKIICVASLRSIKRIDILIKAVAIINEKYDASLTIVGSGEKMDDLTKLTSELNVIEKVVFMGALNRSEISACLRESDVFVLPSRYETFGISLIEALASGVPVVSTARGGPADIIRDSDGRLLHTDNPNELAEAIVLTMTKQYSPQMLRERAQDFNVNNFLYLINKIYEDLT